MELAELLHEWARTTPYWTPLRTPHCGARLLATEFRCGNIRMEFLAVVAPGDFRGLRIKAIDVEDWQFRPSHTLLEGTNPLELVTEDPKLTRAYLESLDCEGVRQQYPERVLMLRHGESYVIARRLLAEWIEHAEDGDPGPARPQAPARPSNTADPEP